MLDSFCIRYKIKIRIIDPKNTIVDELLNQCFNKSDLYFNDASYNSSLKLFYELIYSHSDV